MAKPRTCPHCNTAISIRKGFKFDENLNMICSCCNNVVYPSTKEAEESLKDKKRKGTGATSQHTSQYDYHNRAWPHNSSKYPNASNIQGSHGMCY